VATILVVDDDPGNRDLLEAVLTPAGYAVTTASGGLPALQLVRHAPPDLLLLDLMMPGMNGLEVLATVRAEPAIADLPTILITATSHLDAEESRQALIADDVLQKPIVPAEVLDRVGSLLQLCRTHRELARSLAQHEALDRARYAHRRQVLGRFGVLPEAPAPHAASTVLLAIGDEASRLYYEALLVEAGYRVRPVTTEAEALAAAPAADLAVIALDAPGGPAWLSRLVEAHRGLPTVALAAQPDSALLRLSLAMDVECVLAGLPPAVLLAAVRRAGRQAAARGAEVFLSARIRELERRLIASS
jgi:CheY-like chemotaxis protein